MANKVVSSKVKLNIQKLGKLNSSSIRALEKTGEALHTEVIEAQVMPFDIGTMQNDSTYVDTSRSSRGVVSIITDTPYSRRMYFHPEYNFQTNNNANAQGQWYEPWITGKNKDFCVNAFAKFYKKEAGLQ